MALEVEVKGEFGLGSIPEDVVAVISRPQDQGGGPVDLTSYTIEVDIWWPPNHNKQTVAGGKLDASQGQMKYSFTNPLDQEGRYFFLFWFSSGGPPVTKLHFPRVVAIDVVKPEPANLPQGGGS